MLKQQIIEALKPHINHLQEHDGSCDGLAINWDEAAKAILALLRELNRSEGVTLVLVSHDLNVASTAQRRILMEDGRVVGHDFKGDARAGED